MIINHNAMEGSYTELKEYCEKNMKPAKMRETTTPQKGDLFYDEGDFSTFVDFESGLYVIIYLECMEEGKPLQLKKLFLYVNEDDYHNFFPTMVTNEVKYNLTFSEGEDVDISEDDFMKGFNLDSIPDK